MIVINDVAKEWAKFILDSIRTSHKELDDGIFNNDCTKISIKDISDKVNDMIEITQNNTNADYLDTTPVPIFSYDSPEAYVGYEVGITMSSFHDVPDKDGVKREYTHNKGVIIKKDYANKEETICEEVELSTVVTSCFFTTSVNEALELVKVVFDLGVFDSKFKLAIKDDE